MKQTLKLGLAGSEIELVSESRINKQGQDKFNYVQGFSADGTMSVDFTGTKKNFSVSWEVMSETDFNDLYNIYLLQISNGSFLSYIYTTENGTEVQTSVLMQPPTKGDLVVRDVYYTNAITINMEQV